MEDTKETGGRLPALLHPVVVWCGAVLLPDDGGHDLRSEEDAERGGGLGGEEAQHREHRDGRLTQIWRQVTNSGSLRVLKPGANTRLQFPLKNNNKNVIISTHSLLYFAPVYIL